ncbi:MAG TPA: AAA family ATPase, partial [Ktedonobacterales bacterium]
MDARNHAVKSVVGRKESAASPDMAGPFADLLQRHRRAAKLSQEALAERAGLSRRGVSDLECGVRQTPRADTVARLADALGLSDSERLSFQVASGTLRASSPHEANALVRAAQSSKDQTPVLVGRTLEIALLDRHLGHEGAPLLLLAGEPGIGKSRLLREAGERALAAGWRVLRGGCQRRSVQAPYEPIVDALARYITSRSTGQLRSDLKGAHWLVRLLPELAERTVAPRPQWHLPPAQERRLMFAAVGRFLENVAGARGTLLVLDDLQWAGVDALELLDAVLRQETDAQEADATVPPLRVVGAYRETEVRLLDPLARFLTDTVGEGIALRRQLGPLRDEDARALLSALLRGEEDGDAALCERIVHRSGGVPLFLVSCARGLRSGALSGEGGTEEEIPWDLRQNIRQRVTALPEPAQRLLGVAAIAGREASLGLLESASGQGEEELLAALEAADHARLLVATDSQTYRFVHDVIREVVEADLGRARRQLLHRKVAEALEQRGEHELEQLAYHYEQAGENAKALVYLERVGDRAIERYAAAEAEHIYRLIATLAAAIADRRAQARALEKLGE